MSLKIPRCSIKQKLLLCLLASVLILGYYSIPKNYFTERNTRTVLPNSGSGSVLTLYMFEQLGNGATNLMNMQCWASLLNMNVIEPSIRESLASGSGDGVFYFSDLSSEQFRDLFDIEHWNRFSQKKKYSPLMSMDDFLDKSSKSVIYVKIAYSVAVKCPLENKVEYPHIHTFLISHGFEIVRQVCIDLLQEGRLRTLQEFNDLVFGDLLGQGNFTVVFDEWRAIRNESEREGKLENVTPTSKWHRILIKDSPCVYKCLDLNPYYPTWIKIPAQNLIMLKPSDSDSELLKKSEIGLIPSHRILEDNAKFKTKHMDNKPYIAIVMRMENVKRGIATESSYTKCLETIKGLWEHATQKYGIDQTFVTSDIGKYGSYSWFSEQLSPRFQEDVMKMVGMPASLVEGLETVMGSQPGRVRMAWTQGVLAAQARCVIFLGGGAYQALLTNIHSILHFGRECFVHLDWYCKPYVKFAGFEN